jgi:hypothetical protein
MLVSSRPEGTCTTGVTCRYSLSFVTYISVTVIANTMIPEDFQCPLCHQLLQVKYDILSQISVENVLN